MNKAYVFQHSRNGLQIFVYYSKSVDDAKSKLNNSVLDPDNWIYIGEKIALDAKKKLNKATKQIFDPDIAPSHRIS